MGSVGVVVLTALVQARQAIVEHSATLDRNRRMRALCQGLTPTPSFCG